MSPAPTPTSSPAASNFLSNIPSIFWKIGGVVIIIILIYGAGMLTMYEIDKHNPVKVAEKGKEKHGDVIVPVTPKKNNPVKAEDNCAKNDIHLKMVLKNDILNILASNGCRWASQDYSISCPPKFVHHSLSLFVPLTALWLSKTKQVDGLYGIGLGYLYTVPVFGGLFYTSIGADISYQKSFRANQSVTVSPRATFSF
jgi:hypothetical protein